MRCLRFISLLSLLLFNFNAVYALINVHRRRYVVKNILIKIKLTNYETFYQTRCFDIFFGLVASCRSFFINFVMVVSFTLLKHMDLDAISTIIILLSSYFVFSSFCYIFCEAQWNFKAAHEKRALRATIYVFFVASLCDFATLSAHFDC